MGALILSDMADLSTVADAQRFDMPAAVASPVGGMIAERSDPGLWEQIEAQQPPTFPRDPVTSGFKIATERIMRFGGFFGRPPRGAARSEPRLRARRPGGWAPGQVERGVPVNGQPAGLVPTRPAYEQFQQADAYDTYLR